MVKESRDYLEMAFRSIHCFSDDGRLQVHELDEMLKIAFRDGVVDNNEKRVLGKILSRLNPAELTQEMQDRIAQIKSTLDL